VVSGMGQQTTTHHVARRSTAAGGNSPAPISCYIRTLNEERRIGQVVRAALMAADEVVIVDSGSRDATLRIAAEQGARIIEQDWLGNGLQKQVGEDAAKHDWVLDLDADEVITPGLAEEIRALFKEAPKFRVYQLTLITVPPFGKPWWGFKRAKRMKLYDKRFIRVPPHAAWDQFTLPPATRFGKLHHPILHYAFSGIEHVITKLNRASGVRARESELKPLWSVVLRVYLGLPVYFLKEYLVNGLVRGGTYGFSYALSVAIGRWMRDVKMYERHLHRRYQPAERE
jgi:glycosyltransferase involved in cell wall biosynthesis